MQLLLFHHLVTNQLATAAQNNVFQHVESKHWPNDCHAYSQCSYCRFIITYVTGFAKKGLIHAIINI